MKLFRPLAGLTAGVSFVILMAAPAFAWSAPATCTSAGLVRISNSEAVVATVTLSDSRTLTLPASGHVDFLEGSATTFSVRWTATISQPSKALPAGCVPATTTTHPTTTTTVKATTTTVAQTTTTPATTTVPTTATPTTTPPTTAAPQASSISEGPAPSASPSHVAATLPSTGSPAGPETAVAIALLATGALVVVVARRRAACREM